MSKISKYIYSLLLFIIDILFFSISSGSNDYDGSDNPEPDGGRIIPNGAPFYIDINILEQFLTL